MATILYIATAIGLFIVTQTNGDWEIVRHTLKEKALTNIAVSEGVIIAGTTTYNWQDPLMVYQETDESRNLTMEGRPGILLQMA